METVSRMCPRVWAVVPSHAESGGSSMTPEMRISSFFSTPRLCTNSAAVDRLVRHLDGRIFGMGPLEPARDLLRRPIHGELLGHVRAQDWTLGESTALRPQRPVPRGGVRRRRAIPATPPMPAHFSADRRRRPTELHAQLSEGDAHRQPARDLLTLADRQGPRRTPARRRRDATSSPHDVRAPQQCGQTTRPISLSDSPPSSIPNRCLVTCAHP